MGQPAKRFEDLIVWQKAHFDVLSAYSTTSQIRQESGVEAVIPSGVEAVIPSGVEAVIPSGVEAVIPSGVEG